MKLPLPPVFLVCLALCLATGPASASESGHKAVGKVEASADAKSESKSKGERKADAKTDAKAAETKTEPGPDVKLPPSMGELREMIEHKINEVRATRSPAPVVRLQPKGGARQPGKVATKSEARGPWEVTLAVLNRPVANRASTEASSFALVIVSPTPSARYLMTVASST